GKVRRLDACEQLGGDEGDLLGRRPDEVEDVGAEVEVVAHHLDVGGGACGIVAVAAYEKEASGEEEGGGEGCAPEGVQGFHGNSERWEERGKRRVHGGLKPRRSAGLTHAPDVEDRSSFKNLRARRPFGSEIGR